MYGVTLSLWYTSMKSRTHFFAPCLNSSITDVNMALRTVYSILSIQSKDVEDVHILLDQNLGEELQSLHCETLSVSLDQLKIKFSVPVKFSQCRIQSSKCLD